MKMPKKELEFYLGKNFGKIKVPKMMKMLREKGINVHGKMTLSEVFDAVVIHYNKNERPAQ